MRSSKVKPLLSPEPPANPPTPQKAFQIVQKAIFNELVQLVDGSAGKDGAGVGAGGDGKGWEFKPKKGKPNVLMAVGIQVRRPSALQGVSQYLAVQLLLAMYSERWDCSGGCHHLARCVLTQHL